MYKYNDDSMNEIIVSPDITTFCYVDENFNMVDITDDVPYRLQEFLKRCKFIFGDKIVLDRKLIEKESEDIYEYLIEKSYERQDFLFKKTYFKPKAKEKLLIALNKLFFNKLDNR